MDHAPKRGISVEFDVYVTFFRAYKLFCNWENKTLLCVCDPCYIINPAARQTGWQRKKNY